jgi:hypothetical protein
MKAFLHGGDGGGGEPQRRAFKDLWTLLCEILGLQNRHGDRISALENRVAAYEERLAALERAPGAADDIGD